MLFSNNLIIATLLVRDEEDIIEFNIENLIKQGVGIIIATDNDSKDNSKKILQKYKQVKIIIDEPSLNHDQKFWVTRMAKVANEYNPAWILHVDADELWTGINRLNYEDHQGYLKVPLIFQHPPVNAINWSIQLNEHYSQFFSGLPNTMPKIIHKKSKDVMVGNGNHTVVGCGFEKIIDYINIHHYPVRTYEQFQRKVVQGTTALMNQTGSSKSNAGTHWRQWYDSFNEGNLPNIFNEMCLNCQSLIDQGSMKKWKQ